MNDTTDNASSITLRAMAKEDWAEVAQLIHDSTNAWYVGNGKSEIFGCSLEDMQLFCSVYEALDPGCCIFG